MSIRVILCTPYIVSESFQRGGIQIWGATILQYFQSKTPTEIEIIPVSLDRSRRSSNGFISRCSSGFFELLAPLWTIIRLIKRKEGTILHVCSSGSLGLIRDYLLSLYSRAHGVKMVLHLHFGRIPTISQKNSFEWRFLKRIIQKVAKVIVMDQKSKNSLEAEGFTNVSYLPNPISQRVLNRIASISSRYVRRNKRVLYVGHLYKEKGIYELVEACSTIPDVELIMAGHSSDEVKMHLESLSNRLNFGGLVFLGEITHDEVIEQMLQTMVFALPSYTEGFPNVILESMACGCSIVGTSVGAIPEMLDIGSNQECGICVPPRSVSELRCALMKGLTPEVALLNSRNAKRKVCDHYSIDIVAQALLHIWQDL